MKEKDEKEKEISEEKRDETGISIQIFSISMF